MKTSSRVSGQKMIGTVLSLVYLGVLFCTVNVSAQTTRGLQALWKMDEGVGSKTADASGRGNTGILAGAPPPSWSTGIGSNGLSFSGNGASFVVVAGSKNLANITNAITLTAWVKTPPTANAFVITKWTTDGGTDGSYALSVSLGHSALQLFLNGIYVPLAGATLLPDDNGWHHVAATYDGVTMIVYLDGQPDGSRPASGKIDVVNSSVFLGQLADGAFPFSGDMDNVRIYNRALTAAEILQLFQSNQ